MHELVAPSAQDSRRVAIALKAAVFAAGACIRPEFRIVIADYGLTLLAWAAAAVLVRRPWRYAVLSGIGLSAAAALVQQLHLSPGPRFNHNDLYHVIQAMALVVFYRGAMRLAGAASHETTRA